MRARGVRPTDSITKGERSGREKGTGALSSLTSSDGRRPQPIVEGDFFEGLPEDRDAFLRICQPVTYRRGAYPFFQGDLDQRVFYLQEGWVKIIRMSPCGRESIVSLRHPGELFGLAEVMTGEARRASAQAVTTVSLYRSEGTRFREFLGQHPQVAVRVAELISRRLRDLGQQIEALMLCDPVSRLIKLLLAVAGPARAGRGEPIRVPLPLSQTEVAAMIGSSRQTVNQILRALEAEGLIRVGRAEITILRYDALLKRWAAAHTEPISCATCLAPNWPRPWTESRERPVEAPIRPKDRTPPS